VYGPGPSSKVRAISLRRPPPLVTNGVYFRTWSMPTFWAAAWRRRSSWTVASRLTIGGGWSDAPVVWCDEPPPPASMASEITSTPTAKTLRATIRRRWI